MPILAPVPNQFNKIISSSSTATWPLNTFTCSATPNTLTGAPATLITSGNFTDDAYGIMVTLNGGHASATARSFGVSIYVGGVLTIERMICSGPSCVPYYFPLYIRSGQAVTVDAAANAASLTVGVHVKLFCKPSRPDQIWCGQKVTTFGKHATNIWTGTVVATGASGAKGNWVAMGSATAADMCYWEYGWTDQADTTLSDANYLIDLAEGTSTSINDVIMSDMLCSTEGSELISKSHAGGVGYHCTKSGQNIYARAAKGTSTTGNDPAVCAYGVS